MKKRLLLKKGFRLFHDKILKPKAKHDYRPHPDPTRWAHYGPTIPEERLHLR